MHLETEMSSAWHHKATVRRSRSLSILLSLAGRMDVHRTVTTNGAGRSVSDFSLSNQVPHSSSGKKQVPLLYLCSTYVQCVVVSSH